MSRYLLIFLKKNGFWNKMAPFKWNKYPVTHRNKRKYSIYRPLDNKWQIYLQNVARKHQNHGEVARLHTLLYVFALKTLLAPPNAPLDGWDWLTSFIAADISCCLTGCPIVFFIVKRLPLCWCALLLFTVYIILNIIIWQQSNSTMFNILYRIMKKSSYSQRK
jgi:hypothetical protein